MSLLQERAEAPTTIRIRTIESDEDESNAVDICFTDSDHSEYYDCEEYLYDDDGGEINDGRSYFCGNVDGGGDDRDRLSESLIERLSKFTTDSDSESDCVGLCLPPPPPPPFLYARDSFPSRELEIIEEGENLLGGGRDFLIHGVSDDDGSGDNQNRLSESLDRLYEYTTNSDSNDDANYLPPAPPPPLPPNPCGPSMNWSWSYFSPSGPSPSPPPSPPSASLDSFDFSNPPDDPPVADDEEIDNANSHGDEVDTAGRPASGSRSRSPELESSLNRKFKKNWRECQFIRSIAESGFCADQCVICQVEYEDDESVVALIPCDHLYHSQCISHWLNLKMVCPICCSNPC